jgi:KDO2-lipid IV(A) lauroyltransferase
MKIIRYYIEAFFTLFAYLCLRLLSLEAASAVGGFIARTLGPHVKVHKVAHQNMAMALPHLSETERQAYLMRMWDNLGRVFCEYPHLSGRAIHHSLLTLEGVEHLHAARDSGRPVVFISGHLGNWELLPVISSANGMKQHLLYRPANNHVVDRLVAYMRRNYCLGLHAKGMNSARAVTRAMRNKEPVAMLVDQKTNDGIAVPFFGRDAMTTTAVAQFVLKYDALVLPAHCSRLEGVAFKIAIDSPMVFSKTGDTKADTHAIMTAVNAKIEQWIREDPAQWFWVHKRWPKG